jgi:RNA polymerase I-specific transcription initiation factor RRN3
MSATTPAAPPTLKRSLSDLEAAGSSPLAAAPAAKKPRVQFKSENQIHTLKTWEDEKTLSLVKAEVKRALESHNEGESTRYNELCELLKQKPSSGDALKSKVLKRYLVAITGLCRTVGKKGLALVQAIMQMPWLGRDDEFVKQYETLVTNLLSSYGGYEHEIIFSLISRFTTLRPHHGRLPDESRVSIPQMLDRLHSCIHNILQRVPSSVGQLQMLLRQDFPHASDSFTEHMDYVDNLIRIVSYAPYIKNDIATMIFDKITVLDSQMQMRMDDLADELDEFLGQNLEHEIGLILSKRAAVEEEEDSAIEDNDSDSDEESVVDEFEDSNEKRLHILKQDVAKLDAMMAVLFDFFQPSFEVSKADMTQQFATFDQLFNMFSRVVLTTARSRFIQFLLFHYAQTSEELCERFASSLLNILTDVNANPLVRRSASAYLASFISRASRVSRHLVQHTFHVLSKELERLRALHEKNDRVIPDLNRFGPFYTIFQSLMYIFCFRWRELLTEQFEDDNDFNVNDLAWPQDIVDTFRESIASRMNPLKVCAPPIVQKFAEVGRDLNFIYIYNIIEKNKRIRLSRSMATANGGFSILAESHNLNTNMNQGEEHLQLAGYYPFDPYDLPLSRKRLEGECNDYRPVPGTEEDNDSDTESQAEDDQEVFDEDTETESVGSRR